LLETMSKERPEPSAALLFRILQDADQIQQSFAKPSPARNWIQKLLDILPRPQIILPLGGLTAAALGLMMVVDETQSLSPSEDMYEVAEILVSEMEEFYASSDDTDTSDDILDASMVYAWISGWDADIILTE